MEYNFVDAKHHRDRTVVAKYNNKVIRRNSSQETAISQAFIEGTKF